MTVGGIMIFIFSFSVMDNVFHLEEKWAIYVGVFALSFPLLREWYDFIEWLYAFFQKTTRT